MCSQVAISIAIFNYSTRLLEMKSLLSGDSAGDEMNSQEELVMMVEKIMKEALVVMVVLVVVVGVIMAGVVVAAWVVDQQ